MKTSNGENTRDPDERLHDARMEVEEMKEHREAARAALLAEVDRLRAENAALRETVKVQEANIERLRSALKKCERMRLRAPTDEEMAALNPNQECAWQLKLLDEVSDVARAALEGEE